MTALSCRICEQAATGLPVYVRPSDRIPLCRGHWNAWLAMFTSLHPMDEKPEPPCGAYLIEVTP